jgi:hypothetical protein
VNLDGATGQDSRCPSASVSELAVAFFRHLPETEPSELGGRAIECFVLGEDHQPPQAPADRRPREMRRFIPFLGSRIMPSYSSRRVGVDPGIQWVLTQSVAGRRAGTRRAASQATLPTVGNFMGPLWRFERTFAPCAVEHQNAPLNEPITSSSQGCRRLHLPDAAATP